MKGELVLCRRKGETIVVDTDAGPILITVRRVRDGDCRIGVKAPPEMRVMRGELDAGGGRRFDDGLAS